MELIRWKEGDIWKYPASKVWFWDGSICARSGVGNTASQSDNLCFELLVHRVILVSLGMCMSFVRARVALTFSVRHLNAIKSTAGQSFLGIKPLPALQQM
jgi:hypothetical protein